MKESPLNIHLLRRYLDPKNIFQTPSQEVFESLGSEIHQHRKLTSNCHFLLTSHATSHLKAPPCCTWQWRHHTSLHEWQANRPDSAPCMLRLKVSGRTLAACPGVPGDWNSYSLTVGTQFSSLSLQHSFRKGREHACLICFFDEFTWTLDQSFMEFDGSKSSGEKHPDRGLVPIFDHFCHWNMLLKKVAILLRGVSNPHPNALYLPFLP